MSVTFSYKIDYQNRQLKTVTVIYTPDDVRCLATIRLISYEESWTDLDLRKQILAQAPVAEWEQAIEQSQSHGFDLGEHEASAEDHEEAVLDLNTPKTVQEAKSLKYLWIDARRKFVESRGLTYVFPDGISDVIQVRDERDLTNISGLSTTALILKSQGVTAPLFGFRAESNITHNMTPDQIIAMGVAVSVYVAELYKTGWTLKQLVEAAQTIEEVEEVIWPV